MGRVFTAAVVFCTLLETCSRVSAENQQQQQQQQHLCLIQTTSPNSDIQYLTTNVLGNLSQYSVIIHLNVTGDDTEIQLTSWSNNEFVGFDSVSRNLYVKKRFDFTGSGNPMIINFNVSCDVKGSTNPQYKKFLSVILSVGSTNDHPPVFQRTPYIANISELLEPGAVVFSGIFATDADPFDNGKLTYHIATDRLFSNYFELQAGGRANLTLAKKLYYEDVQTVNLTLLVKDNSYNDTVVGVPGSYQPQFTSTTSIIINVIDEHDINPIFSQATYHGRVSVNSPPGAEIHLDSPIQGMNKLESDDASLIYSIVEDSTDNSWSNFVIDESTGRIFVSNITSLASNSNQQLIFQIKVRSKFNRNRQSRSVVEIFVEDSTVNFRIYNVSLPENAPIGTYVTNVAIESGFMTANYPSEVVLYSFDQSQHSEDFSLNDQTGEVQTASTLNANRTINYNLTICLFVDGKNISNIGTLLVQVVGVVVQRVQFSRSIYSFNVTEEGRVVGSVQASVSNSSTKIAYRLLDNSGLFTIDGTGLIQATTDFSHLQLPSGSAYPHTMAALAICDPPISGCIQDSALVVVSFSGSINGPSSAADANSDDQMISVKLVIVIVIAAVDAIFILIVVGLIIQCIIFRRLKSMPGLHGDDKVNEEVRSKQTSENRLQFKDVMNLDQSNYCTHLSESNVDDESLQSLEAVARSYEQLTTQKTAREMVYMRRKQVTGIGAEQRRVNLNPIGGAPSRGKRVEFVTNREQASSSDFAPSDVDSDRIQSSSDVSSVKQPSSDRDTMEMTPVRNWKKFFRKKKMDKDQDALDQQQQQQQQQQQFFSSTETLVKPSERLASPTFSGRGSSYCESSMEDVGRSLAALTQRGTPSSIVVYY